jgi:hypothetical protein
MQWRSKFFLKDREGETRVVRKFLFFPRCFHNDPFWKWMVWADVVEQVRKVDIGGSGEWGNYAWRWCEIGFAATMKPEDPKKPDPTVASEATQYLLDTVPEDLESGGEEALLTDGRLRKLPCWGIPPASGASPLLRTPGTSASASS